jgi:signal transduction histidine kinase
MGSLYEFSFASRRDKPILHSVLNKALDQISREERNAIYNRWIVFDTTPFYKSRSFRLSAVIVLFTVMLIIAVILFWNATLKAEVKTKTRELRQANEQLEERVEERTEQLSEINQLLQVKIEERAQMARDILNISGTERARIGRELHDSIGQEMVAVTFLCRAVEDSLVEQNSSEADGVGRISRQVESVIDGMKRIVRGLLPVDIMDKGLVVALTLLMRESEAMYGIKCSFNCDDEDGLRISNNALATNIYRIAQEAVNNAAKHAGAKRIDVSLSINNARGVLRVSDDGHGIEHKDGHAGMGLNIMRYRAELARGSLSIKTDSEHGTEIVCLFDPNLDIDEV